MVLGAWALVVVAASTSPQVRVASLGFTAVGLQAERAAFYSEHFATRLSADPGLRVTSPQDVAAMVGVERQRALLGCSSDASCLAELAGAVGAQALVLGQVAQIGRDFQLNVKVLAADGSRTLFVHSSALLSSERSLVEELNRVAPECAAALRGALSGEGPVQRDEPRVGLAGPLVLGGVGLAALIVGGVLLGDAASRYGKLDDPRSWPTLDAVAARDQASTGKTVQTGGVIVGVAGAVALVGGLVWWLVGRAAPPVALSVGPGGVVVTWGGVP